MEETARQCVAARMRTHYGGPAQTFAALEAGLQTRLARALDTTSTPHKGALAECFGLPQHELSVYQHTFSFVSVPSFPRRN